MPASQQIQGFRRRMERVIKIKREESQDWQSGDRPDQFGGPKRGDTHGRNRVFRMVVETQRTLGKFSPFCDGPIDQTKHQVFIQGKNRSQCNIPAGMQGVKSGVEQKRAGR